MRPSIDCARARLDLLDHQRGRLDPAAEADLAAHLEQCSDCAHEDAAERLVTEQLERLPRHAASYALRRRLAASWQLPPQHPARAGIARPRWLWPAAAVLLVAVLVAGIALWRPALPVESDRLVAEAVNDHLRLLARAESLEAQSGDMHRVRPWFAGRLDFAPVIGFPGDADFPLHGGTVEYFLDRRAAALVYGRRLHRISLLVFRADGLAWPGDPSRPMATNLRGFNVRLWRSGELGYALVSDLDRAELARLAARLGG